MLWGEAPLTRPEEGDESGFLQIALYLPLASISCFGPGKPVSPRAKAPEGAGMASGMVQEKEEVRIRFLPRRLTVRTDRHTSLLQAAMDAGLLLDSVCGGAGRCGRCKVQVRAGKVRQAPSGSAVLTAGESDTVLACQSYPESDLELVVPEEPRLGVHQILATGVYERPGQLTPWVRKLHLRLPAPSLTDTAGELERLQRTLHEAGVEQPLVGLGPLRKLPGVVRAGQWDITVSLSRPRGRERVVKTEPGDATNRLFGVAVDVGTTTVVVSLVDLRTGDVVATESTYNRQIACGEDLLARLMFAEDGGLEGLGDLAVQTINELLDRALESVQARPGLAGLRPEDLLGVSVAGNTVMIHFLLQVEPTYIRREPYVPASTSPPPFPAHEVGLHVHPDAEVYLVPGRAGYLGGDVIADVLASRLHRSSKLSLLIDVGTNGEMVLGNQDWLVSCACSAGPAFEGGEVRCGTRATPGAIDRLEIAPNGEAVGHTIGDLPPIGMCGSGLIDLVAELFVHGLIDRRGHFVPDVSPRIREGDEGLEYVVVPRREAGGKAAERGRRAGPKARKSGQQPAADIVLTEADLQNILRTKAAVYAGCSVLLRHMELGFDALDQVVVAGGFGNYLDVERAVLIGLFPDVDLSRYRFIGNGAIAGAILALLSERHRQEADEIAKRLTHFELTTDRSFYEEFASALFLPHTNVELFPSAAKLLRPELARNQAKSEAAA